MTDLAFDLTFSLKCIARSDWSYCSTLVGWALVIRPMLIQPGSTRAIRPLLSRPCRRCYALFITERAPAAATSHRRLDEPARRQHVCRYSGRSPPREGWAAGAGYGNLS